MLDVDCTWGPEIVEEHRRRRPVFFEDGSGSITTWRPKRLGAPATFDRDALFRKVLARAAMPAASPLMEQMGHHSEAVYPLLPKHRRERYSERELGDFVVDWNRACDDPRLTSDNACIAEISHASNRSLSSTRSLLRRAREKALIV